MITILFIIIVLEFKKNVFCLMEKDDLILCISEYNNEKECNITTEFGKQVNLYCPTDFLKNNESIYFNKIKISNDNICFNNIMVNNDKKLKKLEELLPDIILYEGNSLHLYSFFIPHNTYENIIFSCYCIDKDKKKAFKLNVKISKNTKKVKSCNFYYSENIRKNENPSEKNLYIKHNNNCTIDGNANDTIFFQCSSNANSNFIISPLFCFHMVLDENNEETNIFGLINGAKVIPESFFYYNDNKKKKLSSYLLLPSSIQETLIIKCSCIIIDFSSSDFYSGTLFLNLEKNSSLFAYNIYNKGKTEEKINKKIPNRNNISDENEGNSILEHYSFLLTVLIFTYLYIAIYN
ncbi:6-cysteine protein, putative [Plasmodium gallinaceum]|uniref:6-cysteine protein, putative n=1 Tax=Plasmodium gallinaceum TaxID=5849 RepID=A0A1J1H0Y9_PLAGA|nr:6-cysteine protein, putative [Plasmodium gallinaceum]CRG98117.1 6-cysteine protein, putative [Plasmodium gallinaceum]